MPLPKGAMSIYFYVANTSLMCAVFVPTNSNETFCSLFHFPTAKIQEKLQISKFLGQFYLRINIFFVYFIKKFDILKILGYICDDIAIDG